MRFNKKSPLKSDKKAPPKAPKKGVVGYNKKTALLEEAITQMNEGKYGRSSAALKELLALDPLNTEARRLFATLHLRLGSLISARTAFESLAREALDRQDFWLAESLLREYLTAGPRCVPFLDMLGQVYEQKGDSMAAVAEYGKAIEVLVEDPDADHPDRASDLFAKIRALAADNPEAIRLALLFDSATGQLLRPSSVSDSIPSSETPQPANESIAAAADSPPTQTEQPQSYTEPAAEHEPIATSEAPAAPEAPPIPLLEQYQNLSQTALDTAPADDTAEQAHNIHDNTEGERQLRAVQETDDSLPSVLPINDARDETLDAPFKLTDEAATPPASATASDLDPAPAIASDLHPTPAPTHDTTECSVGKNSELASEVIVELIAVPDLSLHEVTQPIAEPPSSPVSMPWDQVQDTTLSIPLPSLEPESEQMPDTETTGQTEEQSVTGTTGMADDQPSLPVQPESLLSSMSWEEILAEVGKGAEQGSPILDHPALESKDPVLTPISEPVAEAQALPVPMPWEQVEEESVPILRHEPEPEFGIVPEHPLPPIIDEPQTLRLEDLKSDANDMTLAIQEPTGAPPVEEEQIHADSSVATRYEPVQEQSVEPPAEPPFNQAYIPPPVEEVSPAPPIPSEPPSIEPAPVHPITEETPLPDTAELVDETAIVADPPPVAEVAEPRVVHTETDPASCEPGRTERGATNAITEISADASAPLPIAHQDFQSTTSEPFTAAAPEPGPALEESISTAQTIEQEPQPAAHEPAASDEIKILWDGRSPQSIPDQAKTGLLSRWLRKPKQDEPAPALESPESAISEPSHDSMSATPSVASELNESLTPDATIHAIATSDLSPDQSTRFLSPVSDEKPRRTKARKPSVASLSTRIATGAGRFISGCFSTTRSIIISLIVLVSTIVISALAAIGLAALTWIFVEEQPSPAFHNLNVTPQRTLQEASTNGYLALLGFDRGPNRMQRRPDLAASSKTLISR